MTENTDPEIHETADGADTESEDAEARDIPDISHDISVANPSAKNSPGDEPHTKVMNRDIVSKVTDYILTAALKDMTAPLANPIDEKGLDDNATFSEAEAQLFVDNLVWVNTLWNLPEDFEMVEPAGKVLQRLLAEPMETVSGRLLLIEGIVNAIAGALSPDIPVVTSAPAPHNLTDALNFAKDTRAIATRTAAEPAGSFKSPRAIYTYLAARIYGQDKAKKAASMIVWNHMHGRTRNAVFVGPTGSGKTAIWEALRQAYPHIVITDASRVSEEGWSGNVKVSDMFRGMPPEEAGNMIYVIDEADKMFEPKTSSGGENISLSIQSEFLKIVEGSQVRIDESTIIDTTHCSFVFLGSFGEMVKAKSADSPGGVGFGSATVGQAKPSYNQEFTPDDLVKYAGMRREIAGRIATIVQLAPMGADEYMEILHHYSHMNPLKEFSALYSKPVTLPDDAARKLCEKAAQSGMGMRYLRARILEEIDRLEFENPDRTEFPLFAEPAAQAENSEEKPAKPAKGA